MNCTKYFKMYKTLIMLTAIIVVHLPLSVQVRSDSIQCLAQETPLYGQKWCKFKRSANELGAECRFKCMEGFVLKGPETNKCLLIYDKAEFVPRVGTCEEELFPLGRGLNGPFHLLNKNNESLLVNQVSIYNSLIADTFMIMVPGLNGVDGTVSLLLSDFPKYCIFSEGETLSVNTTPSSSNSDIQKNAASFWLHSDRFYQNYFAFESYSQPNHFISYESYGAIFKQPTSEENYRTSSFKWEEVAD